MINTFEKQTDWDAVLTNEYINNPDKSHINNAIFSWMDTKENRRPDSQLILIVNDLDKRIPDSLEKATQSYDISMIQWTERNSKKNLDLLAS